MSVVEISADLIDFFGKNITFKETATSTGPSLKIGFFDAYSGHGGYGKACALQMFNGSTVMAELVLYPIGGTHRALFNLNGDLETTLCKSEGFACIVDEGGGSRSVYYGATGYITVNSSKYILVYGGIICGVSNTRPTDLEEITW